jgi:hypothetical protein
MSKSDSPSPARGFVRLHVQSHTQLTYALKTSPSPLQISLQDETPTTGAIELVIVNQQAQPVNVSAIQITVQVGPKAEDLTASTTVLDYACTPDYAWAVTPPQGVSSRRMTYTLGPKVGDGVEMEANDSVIFRFSNIPVSLLVGMTKLVVQEETDSGEGSLAFELAKFPYDFYFGGLVATSADKDEPVVQVPYGGAVTLEWDGSITDPSAYSVLYSSNDGQIVKKNVHTVGQWTSDSLVNDTVFAVQVQATDAGGEPVTYTLSTAVAVQRPDLSVGRLAVAGPASFDAPLTLGTPAAAADLKINGSALLSGSVQAGGAIQAGGALSAASANLSGPVTAADLRLSGKLSVTGDAELSSALVTSNLAVSGTLSAASANVSGTLSVGSLRIGDWTLSVNDKGLLLLTKDAQTVAIGTDGRVYCNGLLAICNQDPIHIYKPDQDAYLNGTTHFDPGARGWVATTYWMSNPPDGDSNLQLFFGSPPF